METKEQINLVNSKTDMSTEIGRLALALSKAQGAMLPAVKESANPFFKSKYADLTSVWDAIRKPLSDNELCVVQTTDDTFEGVLVVTKLIHSSGQWMEGRLGFRPTKPDVQTLGSCLSYLRRYALSAIVGVVQEDDDSNAASNKVVDTALTIQQIGVIVGLVEKLNEDQKTAFKTQYPAIKDIPRDEFQKVISRLNKSLEGKHA